MSLNQKNKLDDKKQRAIQPINRYKFKPLTASRKKTPDSFEETITGQFIKRRLTNDRDCKIIITSKGSSTGLGKTTFAIEKAYDIQDMLPIDKEWKSNKNGFIDVRDYITRYKQCEKFNALLIDEIEYSADSRRAMSQKNVDLSHAWAQLRYRNVVSICTLPSISMLDNRMLELSDLWINVVAKGIALPFYISVNDFTGQINRYQVTTNPEHDWAPPKSPEILNFVKIDEDHHLFDDYEYMQDLKDQNVRQDPDETYSEEDLNKKIKSAERDVRDELVYKIYDRHEERMSYKSIAEAIEMSSSAVSDIVNSKRSEENDD